MRKLLALLPLVLAQAGCGNAVISAAESGDMEAFRAKLEARVSQGDIDVDEAKEIAYTMVKRQIEGAKGPLGVETITAIRECAERFDAPLASRGSHEDEVAAYATLLRQEEGQIGAMEFSHLVNSKDDYWRAVAARSLTKPSNDTEEGVKAAKWRQKLMKDTSTIVRLSAVRAAAEARDRLDIDEVLEAARLDPDEKVRLSAIAAAGAIGTREAVRGLRDLWEGTDHEGRKAIVHAWAAAWRKPFHTGEGDVKCEGKQPVVHASCEAWHQLQRASDEGSGMAALLAALELIHDVSPAKAKTPEGNAAAVVERLIDKGSPRVRIEAIASAPIGWAHLLEAVVDASDAEEGRVAVAALRRMLELEKERPDAIKKLEKVAKGRGIAARAAQRALAEAGVDSVSKLIAPKVKSVSATERSEAAVDFARLGDATHAAALLGDKDLGVRSHAACAILDMKD
jgi:HEAT repeat protein